jgi:hypothetical protein
MIFLPELVGITGKKALESQKAHQESNPEKNLGDAPKPEEKAID